MTAEGTVDSKNVTFNADGTYTVPALGRIEKASVIASLNGGDATGDATVVYGTEWDYSVSYKTATNSRTVYIDAEGYAYIATADYADAGFKGTTEGRVTYVTADNGVTFTEGTEDPTYYRLSGKFGQVVPVSDESATGGSITAIVRDGKYVGANVGRYSNVIPVGRADNFSITGSDGITVTVDKAQLIVAPTDAAEGGRGVRLQRHLLRLDSRSRACGSERACGMGRFRNRGQLPHCRLHSQHRNHSHGNQPSRDSVV